MKPLALLSTLLVLAISWRGGLTQSLSPATCGAEVSGCTTCTDNALGCDTCSVGYVKDGTSCTSCGSGCNNCTTTNGTVTCINCNSAYFVDNGQCSTCLQSCKVCTDKASCTTCEDGYRKLLQGQSCELCQTSCSVCDGPTKCRVCKSEYYLTTAFLCNNCPSDCKTCESSTKCTMCKDGYAITSDDKCAACGSNCAACSPSSVCTQCDANYFLNGGLCYSCLNCNSTCGGTTACTQCDTTYFLAADGTCADCPFNDMDGSSTRCLQCVPSGSNLKRVYSNSICDYCPPECTACSDPNTCTGCADNFYLFNATVCLACDSSCLTCNGVAATNCLTCVDGKYVSGSATCLACNSTCATCSSATVCLTCPDGRYLEGGECKVCPTTGLSMYSSIQCTACAGPYVYQEPCVACTPNCKCCGTDLKCLDGQCESGFYLTAAKECSACTGTSCTECSGSATACTSCSAGNELVSGACLPDCASFEYRDGTNCVACNSTTLGASCLSCSSATVCTDCETGLRLFANSSGCQNCSLYAQADCTAAGGCFWNATDCQPCNDICKECKDNNNDGVGDADECTSCFSDRRFFNNTCFNGCGGNCATCCGPNADQCVTCPANRALQLDGTCAPCTDTDCIDCTGDKDYCNTCALNMTAVDGSCMDCPAVASPGDYDADFCNVCYFVSTQTTYGRVRPRTCARCADHCKACATPGKCNMDMCNTGYVYVSASMTCRHKDCSNPTTQYECEVACKTTTAAYKWTNPGCIKCPANCQTCDTSGVCTSCVANYVRNVNNRCVPCFGESAMCTSCGTSTRGRYYEASGKKCYKCIDNCLSCTNDMSCTTCRPSYYFQSSSPACQPCVAPCLTCKETDGAKECLTCAARNYLNNKTCIACGNNCQKCDVSGCLTCDDQYYPDGNKTCQMCGTGCKTCTSLTSCTTCIDTTNYKSNGACAGCGDSNCASCLNSTYCSTCKTNYYLDRTVTPSCKSCGSFCSICNDTVGCTVCVKGYYLDTNKACIQCSTVLPGCAACDSATECTECFDTTGSSPVYRYLKTDQTCGACSTGCNNCTSATTCSSCSSGYCLWNQGSTQSCLDSSTTSKNCLTCKQESDNTVTCLTCPSNRALKVCEACDPLSGNPCKTCTTEKAKCTSCYSTSFKDGDICTQCATGCPTCTDATTCTCLAANFFDSTVSPKQCKACLSGCGTCSSGTTCSACLTPYRYSPSTGSNKCFYCKPGCYNCTASGCTNCLPGYRLQQTPNVCKPCSVDDCDDCNTNIDTCDDCKRGYYRKSATECAECGSKCDSCGTGTCTLCVAGYYLDRQKVCTQCTSSGCAKCGLPPPTCTGCSSDYTNENSGCTKKCYECTGCTTPTSSQVVSCAADKVCRIVYSRTSAGVETYTRSCDTKRTTDTCDQFSATNLPTGNCSTSEDYCCTGTLCNKDNCDSRPGGTGAEVNSCFFVLLSSYLLSLLARRI